MSIQQRQVSSVAITCVLAIIALLLVASLLKIGKVDVGSTLRIVGSTNPSWFLLLVGLAALNTLLGSEKWRVANTSFGAAPPSRWAAFSLTAVGVGLGQILPAQFATALARIVGTRMLGGGTMVRAGATTLFEQTFDVLTLGSMALVSTTTIVLKGGAALWTALTVVGLTCCWLVISLGTRTSTAALARLLIRLPARSYVSGAVAVVESISAADPRLARRLMLLSIMRYAATVATAATITVATRLDITTWRLAAAVPFAIVASTLVAAPAGLGVNEWAMSAALVAFGTTIHAAAVWVVVSRILSTIAALLVGAAGLLIALILWRAGGQARTLGQPGDT